MADGEPGAIYDEKRCSFDAAVPMLGGPAAPNRDRHYGSRELNAAEQRKFRHRRSLMLFERASSRWWNPQFASKLLETQYWRCAFPHIRHRFRLGLVYIVATGLAWLIYHLAASNITGSLPYRLGCLAIIVTALGLLGFTFTGQLYTRFYVPASFLCTFLICVASLLFFSLQHPLVSPVGTFATSIEVILLLYTVIPLPFYVCIISGFVYSVLFEILTVQNLQYELHGVKFALHLCAHILGVHVFILSQVRNRKTFIKVGQSLLARKDLEVESEFKQRMIESVMPEKVAEELLKESSELRRPSTDGRRARGTIFRPFTMNLMHDVSILFADIAGFTKMSSNKSADELVNLLNDLFGRFDDLCTASGCEKISTLGDCYYCVAGCPEPNPRHAHCCVEMGLGMIVAIRQFDEDRGQDVNMRVGIHTGVVMCGIVGTKRFKFDVFSNDVTLANTMESTGLAGRVHISEATAKFLGTDYILERAEDYMEIKTYFINGRTSDLLRKPSPASGTLDSASGILRRPPSACKQDPDAPLLPWNDLDLRHIDSSEIDSDANVVSAGSKVIAVNPQASEKDKKKSTSLAALSSSQSAKRIAAVTRSANISAGRESSAERTTSNSNHAVSEPRSSHSPAAMMVAHRRSPQATSSTIGSQMNKPQSSPRAGVTIASKDVSGSDPISERQQVTNLFDSVFEYHATSITRFDTAHMDFDQRLAQCIQESSERNEPDLIHRRDALEAWILRFRDPIIEKEYREHFARRRAQERRGSAVDEKWIVAAPKWSVLVDVVIATILFFIISSVAFGVFHHPDRIRFLVYFSISSFLLASVLLTSVWYLSSRRTLIPMLTGWIPKHLLCLLLIDLPLGAAFTNFYCRQLDQVVYGSGIQRQQFAYQLVIAYITFVVIFAHCNFSQLVSWTKTVAAILVGLSLLILVAVCACGCQPIQTVSINISQQLPTTPGIPILSTTPLFEPTIFNGEWPYRYEIILDVILALILIGFLNYQLEMSFRLSFHGDVQAYRTIRDMQDMKDQADWLLSNIIPHHVVDHLAKTSKYSENHEQVAVVFASIVNWGEMYEETFEGGREFLRVLNELIADFDELLDKPQFTQVEKIKTIGATYMAASGLNPERRRLSMHPYSHLYELMDFAMELQNSLDNFNQDILNFDFYMKIGYNIGPVTAGVIGTTKLYYDIWGDTVNIASRMYSTGVKGRIQVSKKAKDTLEDVYDFEFRDHIEVKGIDGGMDVFLLGGRKANMKPRSGTSGTTGDSPHKIMGN